MKVYKKAVLPLGFRANGAACGIKKSAKLDLALFCSDVPAQAAALFTANTIQAAPVKLNKKYLKSNRFFRAIFVNSGNANCFTGKFGLKDAQGMAVSLARALKIKKESVFVSSTGIIGRRLPLLKIKQAIPALVGRLSACGIDKAKAAIMTTDTFTKEATVKFYIGDCPVTICGVAKGAGMIAPHMATMLAFIFTDARIAARALKQALRIAVDSTFNCITVDGCMSTNDSVILLANGKAQNGLIDTGRSFNSFLKALQFVCSELAKSIIKDAEGATKFIQIKVCGARNFKEARNAGLSIANSNLFKTAMYGENPNFGRVIAAIGASGIEAKEENLKVRLGLLDKKEINICVYLGRGESEAMVYTSDLTPQYIKINAQYS